MNETTRQIITAAVVATTSVVVTAIVTSLITKKATIESVAKGDTPLPAGATPTTSSVTPQGSTPSPQNTPTKTPQGAPAPATPNVDVLTQLADQLGWVGASSKSLAYQGGA